MQNRIETYHTLWSLVDLDKEEHLIKKLSTLFLEGMYDWPNPNQENIFEFIKVLKSYIGEPITIDTISSKQFNGVNAWQLESIGSISEMLKLAYKHIGSIKFDEVVDKLLLHYDKEFSIVDFIAELRYLPTKESGRKTPAASGYRPQIKFDFTENQSSGQQTFIDKELAYPGDVVSAKIKILSPHLFYGQLFEDMIFEFREGANIIGTGKIEYIVNSRLEK